MVVDHRTHSVKIGKLSEFLKVYETQGLPLQLKYFGHCVGWYVSNDIGPLSQVVHRWGYKDLADRGARKWPSIRVGPNIWRRPGRCSARWRTRSCGRRLISNRRK